MNRKSDQSPTTELDDEDLAVLEHALGLNQDPKPYRRYYVAPLYSSWFDQCERMAAAGLMVAFGEPDECGQTFHVTQAGADRLGVKLP